MSDSSIESDLAALDSATSKNAAANFMATLRRRSSVSEKELAAVQIQGDEHGGAGRIVTSKVISGDVLCHLCHAEYDTETHSRQLCTNCTKEACWSVRKRLEEISSFLI